MSLFDGFRKKKAEQIASKQEQPTAEKAPLENPSSADSEGYYFESPIELAIYGKLRANNKTVYWLSGDNYWVEYKKGYQLFEQGLFAKAIEAYKKCLELNPIALSARFEICEANLKMGNLSVAKNALLEMKDFLIEEKNIARFYRRMGFIEIEKGNYKVAAACYQYSQKFENHPSVAQELMYIKSKGGFGVASGNPEKVLSAAGLPILTKTTLA